MLCLHFFGGRERDLEIGSFGITLGGKAINTRIIAACELGLLLMPDNCASKGRDFQGALEGGCLSNLPSWEFFAPF
jgi:hypothetical protein